MNQNLPEDLGGIPMLDLFRAEAETQISALTAGLLELERGSLSAVSLEALMRAAHSLKGAARLVNLCKVERLAHVMEDCFEAARRGTIMLGHAQVDLLLRAVDLLSNISKAPADRTENVKDSDAEMGLVGALLQLSSGSASIPGAIEKTAGAVVSTDASEAAKASTPILPFQRPEVEERVLRLTAENLNRLLGLAGESLVESRWLKPFSDSLHQLKKHHAVLGEQFDRLRQAVDDKQGPELVEASFNRIRQELSDAQKFLQKRVEELDNYDRKSSHLSQRLYLEVLRTRMRPFSDGARRFPRMVRDLARTLNKQVRFEVSGESTQVDRDILERLETPLGHLIRNAVDHGCEPAEARVRAGKPEESVVRLEARPSAGVLLVTVSDDGAGVQFDELRRAVAEKQSLPTSRVEKFTEAELLEFLFLPGFTLRKTVTEISGRGYGLDIVQNMVRNVRGAIRLQNQPGHGLRVQLQLPLTLSVLRALLVEVAGEPYAIPLNQISRTMRVPGSSVHKLEGRHYLGFENQQLSVIPAGHLLDVPASFSSADELCVVVLGDRNNRHAVVVDRFLGERELVVQPLPLLLGNVKGVNAAALMENGAPVLILDLEDLLRAGPLYKAAVASSDQGVQDRVRLRPKKVLVVDDSSTVRQLEQRLLTERGYQVDAATDGIEAWTAVRAQNYDLVITDLEMPRMNGLELAKLIKQEPHLKGTAVLIISYKDREEDRLRGLEAGADYYLTKGSFHDQTLLKAVADLIGESDA